MITIDGAAFFALIFISILIIVVAFLAVFKI